MKDIVTRDLAKFFRPGVPNSQSRSPHLKTEFGTVTSVFPLRVLPDSREAPNDINVRAIRSLPKINDRVLLMKSGPEWAVLGPGVGFPGDIILTGGPFIHPIVYMTRVNNVWGPLKTRAIPVAHSLPGGEPDHPITFEESDSGFGTSTPVPAFSIQQIAGPAIPSGRPMLMSDGAVVAMGNLFIGDLENHARYYLRPAGAAPGSGWITQELFGYSPNYGITTRYRSFPKHGDVFWVVLAEGPFVFGPTFQHTTGYIIRFSYASNTITPTAIRTYPFTDTPLPLYYDPINNLLHCILRNTIIALDPTTLADVYSATYTGGVIALAGDGGPTMIGYRTVAPTPRVTNILGITASASSYDIQYEDSIPADPDVPIGYGLAMWNGGSYSFLDGSSPITTIRERLAPGVFTDRVDLDFGGRADPAISRLVGPKLRTLEESVLTDNGVWTEYEDDLVVP